MSGSVTRQQVEEFLYREARLLDDGRFQEWLELFDDEAVYWVPYKHQDADPRRDVSIIYDDRARMGERVQRLLSGNAHSQDPPSVTRRIVGNVEIESEEDGRITVSSNFIIAEFRHDQQNVYAGRYEHEIDTSGAQWRIRRKKVELVNSTQPQGNLSFML